MNKTDFGKNLLIILLFIVPFSVYVVYLNFAEEGEELTFAMLDVGQGDAFFIESPTGTQLLIDAGPPSFIERSLSEVLPVMDRSIDAILMTHPDQDHIGGIDQILDVYDVSVVFDSGVFSDTDAYQHLEDELEYQGIRRLLTRSGVQLDLGGGAIIDVLYPHESLEHTDRNDNSIIIKLTYGNNSFLLTGDASSKVEKELVDTYDNQYLKSNYLKLGHHGSLTASSYDFVKSVDPEYVLISSGKDNKYGHPHQSVLRMLDEFDVQILRTDELGTVIFKCDILEKCKLK